MIITGDVRIITEVTTVEAMTADTTTATATVDTMAIITEDLRIMPTTRAGDILTCLQETGIIIHCHLLTSV